MSGIVKLQCVTTRQLPPGEMIDKETGEIIKWGVRTECKVWLPQDEYPSDYVLKGDHPIGKGEVDMVVSIKKERASVKIDNFKLLPIVK